jgi:Fe-S cluster biogenesis protein NfuA
LKNPNNPKNKIMTTEEIKLNVEKALDEIRPFLESDGGNISLIEIEDDKHVKVRLEGACVGCSVNQMTLKAGVETTIKKYAPQIETVVNVA